MISTVLCCALLDKCFDVVMDKLIVTTQRIPKVIQKHMTFAHLYWIGDAVKIEYHHVKIIDVEMLYRYDQIFRVHVMCKYMIVQNTYTIPDLAAYDAKIATRCGFDVDVMDGVLTERRYNWVGWIDYRDFIKMVENA